MAIRVDVEVRNVTRNRSFVMHDMEFDTIGEMHRWFEDSLGATYFCDFGEDSVMFLGADFQYIVDRIG